MIFLPRKEKASAARGFSLNLDFILELLARPHHLVGALVVPDEVFMDQPPSVEGVSSRVYKFLDLTEGRVEVFLLDCHISIA